MALGSCSVAARCKAVIPHISLLSKSAPTSSSASMICILSPFTAKWSGVNPCPSAASTSAPGMEAHKISALWNVGLAGPCGAARKPAVPTRADLCYGVVDREIVATKCA